MENIKQKIVLPTKGVCNTTPDPICEDNEMEDCVGLTFSDDAIRPIQDVKGLRTAPTGLLKFVHRLNNGHTVNYVTADAATIYWCNDEYENNEEKHLLIGANILSVRAIGNTLIVNTDNGIFYLLYSGNTYLPLGNKIPEPLVEFQLYKNMGAHAGDISYEIAEFYAGDIVKAEGSVIKVERENVQAFYDAAAGIYAKCKNMVAKSKKFCSPFFACYALELYDGTFAMASNPILMLPSYWKNPHFEYSTDTKNLFCTINYASLQCFIVADYSLWKDIVKNVSIFVTPCVELLDVNPIVDDPYDGYSSWSKTSFTWEGIVNGMYETLECRDLYTIFETREESDLQQELTDSTVFYKIAEITDFSASWAAASFKDVPIKSNSTLLNLETQSRLEPIEYFSHCSYSTEGMETFNRRLNLFGLRRTFFEGFSRFLPFRDSNYGDKSWWKVYHYTIEVTIKIDGVLNVVRRVMHSTELPPLWWYYYPDPRATHVKITLKNGVVIEHDLIESKGLNGAYYFGGFPVAGTHGNGFVCNDEDYGEVTLPEPEYLNNYLLQSEVDNPFTFNASGYVRVGQGRIIGIAGLTTALSQDAFKVATTIAFTTQGIWALEIDGEGAYKTVPPPFSREVCSNPKSITMVDKGVYFVSKKGLMLISDNSNGCVTTQLCGKDTLGYDSFIDFIQDCQIAYDYRDSQLWLTNPSYDYHWVYNMKSGTLARKIDNHSYSAIVPDYPDSLLQSGTDVFSMYEEPNINRDKNTYSGYFITRPMKFEQAMAMKSLRDLKHIKDVNPEATIALTIYASNDCASWQQLPSLRGRGFKYFKFKYEFENMKAADAFCGTVLYYTTRLTDRIR